MSNYVRESAFYAPRAAYEHGPVCTLLRNPHIARNEEIQLAVYDRKDNMRHRYLGQLSDVVMVDSHTLAAQRLGGADYDGDLIKTIADPLLNQCVQRNYDSYQPDPLTNEQNLPLLYIPEAEPLLGDAEDWQARFETVRNAFSSRVGQISNAAFDRSVVAYNESLTEEQRRRCREETETLAILTGLEIDSAKSGVRPDLDAYLKHKTVSRSAFLRYKALMKQAEERREWYQPSHRQRMNDFFAKTDWDKVESNVERLPYLAHQLKLHTPRLRPRPAADGELFAFAGEEGWRDYLDADILARIDGLLRDQRAVLSRIRACRAPIRERPRQKDIERILYARGQEDVYGADELYALFHSLPPQRINDLRQALRDESWPFLDAEDREDFLLRWLPGPEFGEYYGLLADFRHGGYRLLGDLVCDVDDGNAARERKQLVRSGDSREFTEMMQAYIFFGDVHNYREAVAGKCRELLAGIIKPKRAVPYLVALGRRDLVWELLWDVAAPYVREVRHVE